MTDHNELDHFPDARKMVDLAARIERAEGPDRALDAEIALAAGWREYQPGWFRPPSVDVNHHASELPRYTGSLDAAMQLVPSGWKLRQMHFNAPCADDRKWHLNLRGGKEGGDRFVGRGSTPALALCAAAIRARSAS